MKRRLTLLFRWVLGLAGGILLAHTLGALCYSAMSLATFLPGLIGAPLLAVALAWQPLARWSRRGWGRVVRWVFYLGYAGFLAAFLVVFPLMLRGALDPPAPGADAVVVLGAGVRGDRVSQTLAYRLDAALSYAQDNPDALVIVSGGQGPGENLPEAEAMANYLMAAGLPPDRLVLEDGSTSTEENFRLPCWMPGWPLAIARSTSPTASMSTAPGWSPMPKDGRISTVWPRPRCLTSKSTIGCGRRWPFTIIGFSKCNSMARRLSCGPFLLPV